MTPNPKSFEKIESVFITGATGVVGSALVEEMLKKTSAKIYLLIRAKDDKHLNERFEKMLKYWGIGIESKERQRLNPIAGDVTFKNWGLSEAQWDTLHLSHLVHGAASVKLTMSEEEAYQSCVVPTLYGQEIFHQLKKKNPLLKLEYISTVGVKGKSLKPLSEKLVDNPPKEFNNQYEKSKFQAEKLLYQDIQNKEKISLHRPSMVVGHSDTGKIIDFQIFYWILILLLGDRTGGFLPNLLKAQIDTIPSNKVAEGILLSMISEKSEGRVFHYCSGPEKSMNIDQLMKLFYGQLHQNNIPFKKPKIVPSFVFESILNVGNFLPIPQKIKKNIGLLRQIVTYSKQDQSFLNPDTRDFFGNYSSDIPDPVTYMEKSMSFFITEFFKKSGKVS